jgi:hypothetical protein
MHFRYSNAWRKSDAVLVFLTYRGMEQWSARWAHNPKAGGSNPSPANFNTFWCSYGGIAQLVRAAES